MVLAVRTEQKLEDRLETLNGVINHRGIILLENENRGMFQAMRIVEELKIEPSIHFVSNRDSLILSLESGERATILPASILLEMQNPHLQILHFGVPSAALHYFFVTYQFYLLFEICFICVLKVASGVSEWRKQSFAPALVLSLDGGCL